MDIPTRQTLDFVRRHLTGPRRRVLEVGCGEGALAWALQEAGHEVVAIDEDDEAVVRAVERGVDARRATWPDFDDAPFDAVLFTHSLHHIHPLGAALDRTGDLLESTGLLLVEDFAYETARPETVAWFRRILTLLATCEVLRSPPGDFIDGILRSDDPYEAWRLSHDDHLHAAEVMLDAIQARFRVLHAERVPYLYRYVAKAVEEGEKGTGVVTDVLGLERHLGQIQEGSLIGRRFVAERR
jgi:SAM-dependent methyltransferase